MKISKPVSYAINWLSHNNKSVEEIAQELNLTEKQVLTYLEKNNIQSSTELAIKSSPVNIKSKDLMIRHTQDKRSNNIAIMTKEASQLNDALKKKINTKTENKNTSCIFKPNKD